VNSFSNFIGGSWATVSRVQPNINPSNTDDVIGEYAVGSPAEASSAITAAHDAFPTWSVSPPQQRADILDRIGTEILARKDELGDLLAREEG
jgi:aldehyde dehydrogenase (NAD+)